MFVTNADGSDNDVDNDDDGDDKVSLLSERLDDGRGSTKLKLYGKERGFELVSVSESWNVFIKLCLLQGVWPWLS